METSRTDLLVGLNGRVSLQVVGLGIGLFAFVSAVFYTEVNNLWPLPAGATGLVVLVGLAATHAYANAGIVTTWALVYGAAQPAFLFHAPRGGPRFAVEAATVPEAVGAALAVALATGTAGFALGLAVRRYRDRTRDTRYEPSPEVLPNLLLGRNRRVTAGYLALGVVLVPVGLGFTLARGLFPLLVVGLCLVAVVAAIQAYRNGGLLVSWLLASLPVFGFVSGVQYGPATPQAPLLYAVGTAALVGVPVGTVSFLLGAAARHLRGSGNGGRRPRTATSEVDGGSPSSGRVGASRVAPVLGALPPERGFARQYLFNRRVGAVVAVLVSLWVLTLTTGALAFVHRVLFAGFFATAPTTSAFENLAVSAVAFYLWLGLYVYFVAVVVAGLYGRVSHRLRGPSHTA